MFATYYVSTIGHPKLCRDSPRAVCPIGETLVAAALWIEVCDGLLADGAAKYNLIWW